MIRRALFSLLAGFVFSAIFVFALPLPLISEGDFSPDLIPPVQEAAWTIRSEFPDPRLAKGPRVRCASALVVDNVAGEILYERDAHTRRPIASLTKLLTAMVFLESRVDLDSTAQITDEDAANSSRSYLRNGEILTLREFLYAALMTSDNRAARVLSRSAGITQEQFVERMNEKVRELGLDSTFVVEPTGLSELNVSTAFDCARLVNAAVQNHLIRHITQQREFTIQGRDRRHRTHRLANTNRLLYADYHFACAKTGYILEAGWCIAARATSPQGNDVTTVVLGAPSDGFRFGSLRNAINWAFALPTHRRANSRSEG